MNVQCKASPIIRIDRSIVLEYPDWVYSFLDFELEKLGPVEFDVGRLIQDYPNGPGFESLILASDIIADLEKMKLRERCLGFREAEAVKNKGVLFFRKYFAGEAVICWKSIVCTRNGFKYTPFLFELHGEVAIDWIPLDIRRSAVNKLVYFPE